MLNLLQTLHADYDITLLLFYCGGALLNEVPSDVRVCAAGGAFRYFGMTKNDVLTVHDRLLRAFWAGVTRVLGMPFSTRLACLLQKSIQGFDAAISFLHSGAAHTFYGGCNAFVLNCVDAKKKITYLHCDYGQIRAASAHNAGLYRRFDEIVACSDGCRRAFLNAHPQLTGKTCVIPNFQNDAAIVRLAKAQPVNLDHGRPDSGAKRGSCARCMQWLHWGHSVAGCVTISSETVRSMPRHKRPSLSWGLTVRSFCLARWKIHMAICGQRMCC